MQVDAYNHFFGPTGAASLYQRMNMITFKKKKKVLSNARPSVTQQVYTVKY